MHMSPCDSMHRDCLPFFRVPCHFYVTSLSTLTRKYQNLLEPSVWLFFR